MKTKLVSSNISFFACRTALLLMLFIAGGNVVLAQDPDFPALNLDKVRTRYKTLIYNPTNWTAQLHLFTNGPEVAGHTGAKPSVLAANGYVRWYLEDKDGHYVDFDDFSAYNTDDAYAYTKKDGYGYYRTGFNQATFTTLTNYALDGSTASNNTISAYDPLITIPTEYRTAEKMKELKLIALFTSTTKKRNLPGVTGYDATLPTREPEQMQMKYVYSFVTAAELTGNQTWPFIHFVGEGANSIETIIQEIPDIHGIDDIHEAEEYTHYATVGGTPGGTQYSWDYKTGTYGEWEQTDIANIRQNVHKVDYYYFLNLEDGDEEELMLPIQNYLTAGTNDAQELRAYIRWYDYNTDMGASYLKKKGRYLKDWTYGGQSYGLIGNINEGTDGNGRNYNYINSSANNGAWFVAPSGFKNYTENQEITIACDLSGYMDGRDESYRYFIHEPTIETRMLFHILPAKVLADRIEARCPSMSNLITQLQGGVRFPSILENNGRSVVSVGEDADRFTLRTAYKQLKHYYIRDNNKILPADQLIWYAIYRDDAGEWWQKKVLTSNKRINDFTKAQFSTGTWTNIDNNTTTPITVPWEHLVYAVACIKSNESAKEVPIVMTSLDFQRNKPIKLGPETETNPNNPRSRVYMEENYVLAGRLDFNGFSAVNENASGLFGLNKPTTCVDNYMYLPLPATWGNYGFIYPQLYGLQANEKSLYGQRKCGIAPIHGEYTLLKSMNFDGLSKTEVTDQSIYTAWYMGSNWEPIFDVTHERAHGKTFTNDNDYGYFLYVDASDEARTIASLEFDAAFCDNGKVVCTAYVADATIGATKPNLRFRFSTYNTYEGTPDGRLVEGETELKKIPFLSFQTGYMGDQVSMASSAGVQNNSNYWYQVYGECIIPPGFSVILNGTKRHYYMEVDNYCANTQGADYCIDEISLYTQTDNIIAKIDNDICDDDVNVRLTTNAHDLLELISLNVSSATERKTIFYRIDEVGPDGYGVPVTGEGLYTNEEGVPSNNYGAVTIDLNFDLNSATSTLSGGIDKDGNPDPNSGFYKDENGEVMFQLFDHSFSLNNLQQGHTYFVSFYELAFESVNVPSLWGDPKANSCSMYSNRFTPRRVSVELEDDLTDIVSNGNITFPCGEGSVEKTFNITLVYPNDDGTEVKLDDIKFDFFTKKELSTGIENAKQEFNSIQKDIVVSGETVTITLYEALIAFRKVYKEPVTGTIPGIVLPSLTDLEAMAGYAELTPEQIARFQDYLDFLTEWVNHTEDEGQLMLRASTQLIYNFTESGERHFGAMPINFELPEDNICTPIEVYFRILGEGGKPDMKLGFDDVEYPEEYEQVVRVGLEQLTKMKSEGYKLHIPVRYYSKKAEIPETTSTLLFQQDTDTKSYLILTDTNDPTVDNSFLGTAKFARLLNPRDEAHRPLVNTDYMYLVLDLSECPVDIHEGYWYEVSASYYDIVDDDPTVNPDGEAGKCWGDVSLVFKIVPEFITWQATEEFPELHLYSANWYNDANWQRSVREDLYKGDFGTATNTGSPGHPDGYKDNSEIDPVNLTENPAYVPMKFSYVTMLTDNHAPSLIGEPKQAGRETTGGDLIDPSRATGTYLLTDVSPINISRSSSPTPDIRYDMLVRYGENYDEGGEGCHGHRHYTDDPGTIWEDITDAGIGHGRPKEDAKVFDVEKFYGNICKEIYFKPGAELLKQHRLTYEKAWAEKLLTANKWYLMSSPLKNTYAGDMYVPVSATPEANGRQETEAFQDIRFTDTNVKYSRTQYPIYQRSWGMDAKVYTKTDDIRANDYAAQLAYSSVSSQMNEWGHTYNDVWVSYNKHDGFSIRAQRKDQKDASDNNVPALIRLPKADTAYQYYQWDDTDPATQPVGPEGSTPLDKSGYAKLVFDKDNNSKQIEVNVSDLQHQTDGEYNYYLVGNPFMSAIDMGKFYAIQNAIGTATLYNPDFDRTYYTYEEGELKAINSTATPSATSKHIVKPLQAIFLRCRIANTPEKIIFHTDMMTDGNYEVGTSNTFARNNAPASSSGNVKLFASNNRGSSSANVMKKASASEDYKDDEDAKTLFDTNLADVPVVFTTAGQQAVSIDARPTLDLVPFGVACANTNDLVEVVITGTSSLRTELYVVDAVSGAMTTVHENQKLLVQPNDYGRYFLTTNSNLTAVNSTEGGIVISVRGRQVTVHAASNLKTARVITIDGITVNSNSNNGSTDAVFNLKNGGIYIVEAETAGSRKVIRVAVK